MKVLKQGQHKTWTLKVKCSGTGNGGGGCGAELLLEEGDLFHTYRSSYDGSNETYTTFRCCSCKSLTDIPNSKVPPHVNVRARELGTGIDIR